MSLRVLALVTFAALLVDASCAGCGTPAKPDTKKGRGDACGASGECGSGLQCLTVNGAGNKCTDPNDLDGDGIPNAEDTDIDGDGTPNAGDSDVDGDGIPNATDPTPYGPNNGGASSGDGSTPHTCLDPPSTDPGHCNPNCIGLQGDCDNDGVPNQFDNDDNGDNVPDGVQGAGSCDGGATTTTDENKDCDGYCLTAEGGFQPCDDCPYPPGSEQRASFCANPGAGVPDSDGDGQPDNQDPDPTGTGQQPPPAAGEGEGEGEGGAGEGEGEGSGPGNCSTVSFNPGDANLEPRILFVVDKSGSMDEVDLANQQKYAACAGAIEQVASNLNGTIDMGLMHFPGNSDADACSQGVLDVNVASGTAGQIANVLNGIGPGGGTPTAVTLLQAKAALDALPSQGGPRAVVLATDGGPNCNLSLDGNSCRCVGGATQCQGGGGAQANCLDDSNTINAAAQLNAAGYSVFVIGEVGSENFSDVLNSLATAGGTALSGSLKFYAATQQSDLVADLEDIAVRVGACRIDVGQNVTAPQISVTVTVNGQPTTVNQDTSRTDGWDLVDAHTVELFGQACTETVQGGAQASVAVQVCDG